MSIHIGNNTAFVDYYSEIKQEIDIFAVAEHYGIEIYNDKSIRCINPEHDDKNPSMHLVPIEKKSYANSYKCFSCGVQGTVIDFIMLLKGMTLYQATEEIKQISTVPTLENLKKRIAKRKELNEINYDLRTTILTYIADENKGLSNEAKKYLNSRGISFNYANDMYQLFDLKSPGSTAITLMNTFGLESLQLSGLFSKEGNFIFSRHTLMFPWHSYDGQVNYMQGRSMVLSDRPYMNCAGTIPLPYCAFGLDSFKKGAIFYITESVIDTISLQLLGFPNIIGSTGANFKEEWIDIFVANEYIPINAFDNDDTGRIRSKVLYDRFKEKGVDGSEVKPPNGFKDWNDCLKVAKNITFTTEGIENDL